MAKTAKEQIGVDIDEPEPIEQTLPEAEVEEVPEAPERPEWLPEQYKTPEDFAQAHKSAQDKIREQGEQLREREQQIEQIAQQMQAPQTDPSDVFAQVANEIEVARENGDVARELQLNQWLTAQTVAQTFQGFQAQTQQQFQQQQQMQTGLYAEQIDSSMERQIPDWGDYRERVAEVLQERPGLLSPDDMISPDKAQRALRDAYDLVKAQDLMEQQATLAEKGLTAADVGRARKLQAATVTGSSARPDQPSPMDVEMAEMKQALHGSSYAAFRSRSNTTK